MKTIFVYIITLSLLFVLFPPNASAQGNTQLDMPLPEGAKLRIGKGTLEEIAYFPDATRFAIATSIGIRIYDSVTGKELNQLTDSKSRMTGFKNIRFSPDGKTIATNELNETVLLWHASTGRLLGSIADVEALDFDSICFSPNGDIVAAAVRENKDGREHSRVQLWDARTGKYLRTLTRSNFQSSSPRTMIFSPDGKIFTAWRFGNNASNWGRAELGWWNVDAGELIRTFEVPIKATVYDVRFSPDGRTFVTRSNRQVDLWDVSTRQHLKTIIELDKSASDNRIKEVRFSPDGKTLAIWNKVAQRGRYVERVYLWDTSTQSGKYLHKPAPYLYDDFSSISFSPDGKFLAADSSSGTTRSYTIHSSGKTEEKVNEAAISVHLWDTSTGKHLTSFFEVGGDAIFAIDPNVCFSPNGKVVAASGVDGRIHLWSVTTGQNLIKLTGHTGSVRAFSFSPDGITILSKGSDKTVRLWDAITGELLKTLIGYTDDINAVSFSPDGKTIARGNLDTVQLLDVSTGQLLKTLTGSKGYISSLFYASDGKTIVCKSNNTVCLWNVNTGQLLETLKGINGNYYEISFSPNGKMIAIIGAENTIQLWDTGTAQLLKTLITDNAHEISFSLDGNILVSNGSNGVQLWDTRTGELVRTLSGISGTIDGAHFSPDTDTIITSIYDESPADGAFLYDGRTGELLEELSEWSGLESGMSSSPDGNIIAMVGYVVKLFDLSNRQHLSTLSGHLVYDHCGGGTITTVRFSPDGQTVVSGSLDKTIRLWNPKTGEHLKTLTGHTYAVNSVAFSPDGKTLASGSSDGTILLWEVP